MIGGSFAEGSAARDDAGSAWRTTRSLSNRIPTPTIKMLPGINMVFEIRDEATAEMSGSVIKVHPASEGVRNL